MLFAAPKVIETSVFAHLPDELKLREATRHEWVESQPFGGPKRSLLEGPSFDKEGNLYCVDLVIGRVLKVTADGEVTCLVDNIPGPNGLVMNKDETALYVAVTQ
ncbi:MAG: hypothetical protein ACREUQ_10000 [Burkholderiales bacterium]